VLELCAMVGTGLVAATIGVQLTGGHLGLDAGLTVLLLAPELYAPLRQVGQQFHASADGLAAAGSLLAVLDEPGLLSGGESGPRGRFLPQSRAALEFQHASFTYPGRPGEVLHELNLTIAPQEFVAVTGSSGAGKSTLAALALRLADPTSGAVTWGEVDLREIPLDDWRAQTAWVPQRVKLFSGTLADNIALADPTASPERIRCAAAAAGLAALVDALPEGLGTEIGDGGRTISAGQAQRVALARAFLSDAALVVLDEPTANLDTQTAAGVADAITQLAEGRTMLVITHDRRLAAQAARTIELTDGALRYLPTGVAA
jgi:ABC-type transport system involved in cytochrome bd biosynthesis fused ATPase/permease subunit